MDDSLKEMLAANVGNYLIELARKKFYGEVRVKFEAGEVMIVRKEESFKPHVFLVVGQ